MQRPRLPARLRTAVDDLMTPPRRAWVRRLLVWALIGYGIRYVYYGNFLTGASSTLWILSLALLAQTMTLYYVFAYSIFPKTLYEKRVLAFLGWFLLWNFLLYQSNYWLFYWLKDGGEASPALRFWKLLDKWGTLGVFTNSAAIFWNFFWSFPVASLMLTIKAVSDLLRFRTQTIRLEKDKLALELDFLKAQINPHFLFNTLNSVYARVFDIDEQAGNLLLRLAELMRYNLYETNQPQVLLSSELAYIQNYLDLERDRLEGQRVVITYEQVGSVTTTHHIAPLLLLAFVENAFKHGVRGTTKQAFVRVRAEMADDMFLFTVANSVFPRRQVAGDTGKKSGGMGLDNVRRRLGALYPNRHKLVISPGEALYTVSISVQL